MKKTTFEFDKVISIILTVMISVGMIVGVTFAFRGFVDGEKTINKIDHQAEVDSFFACIEAGGSVAESYPRQCFFDELSFVEDLGGSENKNEIFCVNNGGSWERVGKLQAFDCVYKYSDGGKTCESSADCEGDCIVTEADGSDPHCAFDSNIFGCKSTIENWQKDGGILCVD